MPVAVHVADGLLLTVVLMLQHFQTLKYAVQAAVVAVQNFAGQSQDDLNYFQCFDSAE